MDGGVDSEARAGWHQDPTGRHQHRYWDGTAWTDHVANDGATSTDPLTPPPPSANPAPWGGVDRRPLEALTFGEAVRSGFTKYVEFRGRSQPSEYWWWFLFNLLLVGSVYILGANLLMDPGTGDSLLGLLFFALFLPGLSVTVRRLHDIDRSGWWLLVSFVPLVGPITMLVFLASKGTPGPNRYGMLGGAVHSGRSF